jgi:hypothetical protein
VASASATGWLKGEAADVYEQLKARVDRKAWQMLQARLYRSCTLAVIAVVHFAKMLQDQ